MAKGGHTVGQCDLLLEGRPVGALSWQEEGQGWQIHACCPVEEGMIYRVMLDLEGGSTWVAGVMIPEFGKFSLHKRVPFEQAHQWGPGLRAIRGAEIIRTKPGEPLPKGPLPFPIAMLEEFDREKLPKAPPELLEALAQGGAKMRFNGDGYYVVVPMEPTEPFALNSAFCMATPVRLEGKWAAAIKIREDGTLDTVHISADPG